MVYSSECIITATATVSVQLQAFWLGAGLSSPNLTCVCTATAQDTSQVRNAWGSNAQNSNAYTMQQLLIQALLGPAMHRGPAMRLSS